MTTRRRPKSVRVATACLWGFLLCTAILPVRAQTDDTYGKSLRAAFHALRQYGGIDDPAEQRRLQDIGYRVGLASGFEDYPLSFYLLDIPEPNAFALPGGHIFVTQGMLALDLDDHELAALLGHEIAHVALKHGTRLQKKAALLNGLSAAVLVGVAATAGDEQQRYPGEIYTPSNRADLIQGTMAAGTLVTELLLRNYGRTFENESDLEGQRWAAGAGYDPDGARTLMAKMAAAIPQDRSYGYWRTHPFGDQRVRAAIARSKQLKAQPEKNSDDYRRETQRRLLAAIEDTKEPELKRLLEDSAVASWPRGPAIDAIRRSRLDQAKERELAKHVLSRNYHDLLTAHQELLAQVQVDDEESPLIAEINASIGEVRELRDAARSAFAEAYHEGVMQTESIEAMLANYPDFDEAASARLKLAQGYTRLERPLAAIEQFVRISNDFPDSEEAVASRRAMRVLVTSLDDLCALDRLNSQESDPILAEQAQDKLAAVAETFDDLANGAAYLECAPEGLVVEAVRARLEVLAESRLADVLLHQRIGNGAQAVDGIDDILTHAPWTEAANRLRQRQSEAAGEAPATPS